MSRTICQGLGLGSVCGELMGMKEIRNQKILSLSAGWGTQNKLKEQLRTKKNDVYA